MTLLSPCSTYMLMNITWLSYSGFAFITNTTPFLVMFITPYGTASSDHLQNLTNCSLYHCRAILKILSKSVKNFLRNVANRQTSKQTNKQTKWKHYLRGGGNNNSDNRVIQVNRQKYRKRIQHPGISVAHAIRLTPYWQLRQYLQTTDTQNTTNYQR